MPAAELGGLTGQCPHRVGVAQVGGDEVGFPARRADRGHGRVPPGRVPAAEQDVRAPAGEQDGGGAPDAAGRTGYEGGGASQVGGGHDSSFARVRHP